MTELKACLEPTDMPTCGGNRPLRACGKRFVAHKVAALERLINTLNTKRQYIGARDVCA